MHAGSGGLGDFGGRVGYQHLALCVPKASAFLASLTLQKDSAGEGFRSLGLSFSG